jgi:hypothetical protein
VSLSFHVRNEEYKVNAMNKYLPAFIATVILGCATISRADIYGYQFMIGTPEVSQTWTYFLDSDAIATSTFSNSAVTSTRYEALLAELVTADNISTSSVVATSASITFASLPPGHPNYSYLPPDYDPDPRSYQDDYEVHFQFYISGFGGGLGDLAYSMGVMLEEDAFDSLTYPYDPFIPDNSARWSVNIHYPSGSGLYSADTFSAWVVPEPSTLTSILMGLGYLLKIRRRHDPGTNANTNVRT